MFLNAVDITIIVIVTIFAFCGLRKGLVGTIIGFVSIFAAIILAWILYPIVVDLLTGVGIRDYVYEVVLKKFVSGAESGIGVVMLPGFMADLVSQGINSAATETAGRITDVSLNVISFALVFIVARVIIHIAEKLLKVASKLHGLNGINKLAGFIVGFLKGAVIIYIAGLLVCAIVPMSQADGIAKSINESYIIKKMYSVNPIMNNITIMNNVNFEKNGD